MIALEILLDDVEHHIVDINAENVQFNFKISVKRAWF